ncbi:MAG: GIY-YIG nuclease family protein [Chloroflexota bacterium]|nr:GIY-YIG nuclease family protein [Chloroflexota bacterium]
MIIMLEPMPHSAISAQGAASRPAAAGSRPGTYVLLLRLRASADVAVGRLGRHRFPKGWYVYVGSALGGVDQRVARHVRSSPVRRWHIDYLRAVAPIREVAVIYSDVRLECAIAGDFLRRPGAGVMAPRFGSSDCRCPTHLVHFRQRPALALLGSEWSGRSVRRAAGGTAGYSPSRSYADART